MFRFTTNENRLCDLDILDFYRKKVDELHLAKKKVIDEFGRDKKITSGFISLYTQTLRTTGPRPFTETVLYN